MDALPPPTSQQEDVEQGTFFVETKQGHVDAYDIGSGWYYVFHVMLIIYGLGYIASLVLIQNVQVEHTFHKANVHGVLYSDRYVSAYWLAVFLMTFRPLIFVVVCSLLLYRNTTCCGNKATACSAFWVVLLVLFVLADLLSFAIMSSFWTKCNGLGQAGNPCNSYKWCCAANIYSDPSNLCSITAACDPVVTLSELQPNVDFVWLFSVSVAFAAFDVFFLMVPIALWLSGSSASSALDSFNQDEAEDDLMTDDQPANVFSAIATPIMKNTRMRKKVLLAQPTARRLESRLPRQTKKQK